MLPPAPSQASMATTSSSHDPDGGLNSAFFALAGGDPYPGCRAVLRPRLAPLVLSLASTLERALFLPRLAPSFFSRHASNSASLPPTFARYSLRASEAVSLRHH